MTDFATELEEPHSAHPYTVPSQQSLELGLSRWTVVTTVAFVSPTHSASVWSAILAMRAALLARRRSVRIDQTAAYAMM